MADLEICLLGGFQVSFRGETVTAFRSNKVRALLAFLCVESDQLHQREKLAGLLWPDQTENAARSNLRHSLSNLRTAIGDRDLGGTEFEGEPFLQITPQTIGFFPNDRAAVDTSEFLSLTDPGEQQDNPRQELQNQLEAAAAIYGGSFLDGFSLPDCAFFEEWLILERERFQARYQDVLRRLGQMYEQNAEFDLAIDCARRRVEINPFNESAHRQLMRLLWICGRVGEAAAQFQTCRKILDEELSIEPSETTRELYSKIKDGALPPIASIRESLFNLQVEPPDFFSTGKLAQPTVFVGREDITKQLNHQLSVAFQGQPQVSFISGEAGSGKSSLLKHFIAEAVSDHPDLLAVQGSCSSLVGFDDPYLPFREAFDQLCGNVKSHWRAGSITIYHAFRLWNAMPAVASFLIEHGADLFGSLVNGHALYSRLKMAIGPDHSLLFNYLEPLLSPVEEIFSDEKTNFLIEQTCNVLNELSTTHPILWVLDDIHWIDIPSCNLLFHLTRRLKHARILMVCAYRPEDLPQEHRGGTHPLRKFLSESKRRLGDVWINMNEYNTIHGLEFTNTFLDLDPNTLDQTFRDNLFSHTSGNPLFTIEQIRSFQDRGELRKDRSGRWQTGSTIMWDQLPAKVEGVIEERVISLTPDRQELLEIASVEGEIFTPYVVAQVSHQDHQELLEIVSEELDKRSSLVSYHGVIEIDNQLFPTYQFRHGLFQSYIYNALKPFQKQALHLAVGHALENLYRHQLEDVAAQLSIHFDADRDKARHYHQLAGQVAINRYAYEIGIQHYRLALNRTPDDDLQAQVQLLLLCTRAQVEFGDPEGALENIARLYSLLEILNDPGRIAETAIEETRAALQVVDFPRLLAAAERAEKIARELGDLKIETFALRQGARALDGLGKLSKAETKFKRGLALAKKLDDPWLVAEISRNINTLYLFRGQTDKARPYLENAQTIFRTLGEPKGEVKVLASLGHYYDFSHQYQLAIEVLESMIDLTRKVGWIYFEIIALNNLSATLETIGYYDRGIRCAKGAAELAKEMKLTILQMRAEINVACNLIKLNQIEPAKQLLQHTLEKAKQHGSKPEKAYLRMMLGRIHLLEGQPHEAYQEAQAAIDFYKTIHDPQYPPIAISLAASSSFELGELETSLDHVDEILDGMNLGTKDHDKVDLPGLWDCYRILAEVDGSRAIEVLELGYRVLQERASHFTNPEYRSSYLNNVAENAGIVSTFQESILQKAD